MLTHYDEGNLDKELMPSLGEVSERDALYVILRDFLSDAEIFRRIKDVYGGKYAMRNSGGYQPHHIDSNSDGSPPVNP